MAFRALDDSFMAASFIRLTSLQRYAIMVLSSLNGAKIYDLMASSDFVLSMIDRSLVWDSNDRIYQVI